MNTVLSEKSAPMEYKDIKKMYLILHSDSTSNKGLNEALEYCV